MPENVVLNRCDPNPFFDGTQGFFIIAILRIDVMGKPKAAGMAIIRGVSRLPVCIYSNAFRSEKGQKVIADLSGLLPCHSGNGLSRLVIVWISKPSHENLPVGRLVSPISLVWIKIPGLGLVCQIQYKQVEVVDINHPRIYEKSKTPENQIRCLQTKLYFTKTNLESTAF